MVAFSKLVLAAAVIVAVAVKADPTPYENQNIAVESLSAAMTAANSVEGRALAGKEQTKNLKSRLAARTDADRELDGSDGGDGGGGRKRRNKCRNLSDESLVQEGWSNWLQEVQTIDTPVYRPTDDTELLKIVKKAKRGRHRVKCRLRPVGATHSEDGMVIQRREEDVALISMASHVTTQAGWTDGMDLTNGVVTIGAGRSLYELMKIVRPNGYLLFIIL
jgi:hypothetical protein